MTKYSESFLRFYSGYPKKKGKFEGNKTWIKQKLEKIEDQIINHVKLSIKYDTDWKLGRIPYASTYLNQHRYEDEISGCYKEPETNVCVPVKKIPRDEVIDSPDIQAKLKIYKDLCFEKINFRSEIDRLAHQERITVAKKNWQDAVKNASCKKIGDILGGGKT